MNLLKKILNISLIILGFVITLAIVSNSFDGDFGWHLRFGKDATNFFFPYLDTYTFTYFGKLWINHEWGGDMMFWFLYSKISYFAIIATISAAVWGSFLLIPKIFYKKLSTHHLIASIISLLSVKFVLAPRLAMFSVLFFVFIIYILEQIPNKKTYYLLPVLLLIWSFVHGSWILGFILINIYLFSNLLMIQIKKINPKWIGKDSKWTIRDCGTILLWQIISALIIIINPYKFKIWQEVSNYFSLNYFKQIINEWLPSYSYPVYTLPLIFSAISIVIIFIAWQKKKITFAQIILFIAIFISAWKYKRNNIYLAVLYTPICAIVIYHLSKISNVKLVQKLKIPLMLIASIFTIYSIITLSSTIKLHNNIWNESQFLTQQGFPYHATQFLKKETKETTIDVFNEFRWGGFLNWNLQNARVFLDGRGTATWIDNNEENLLKKYREIKYEKNGLAIIEQTSVQYILLAKNSNDYPKPNRINKIIFTKKDFEKIFIHETSELEKTLTDNKNWKLIYEDKLSKIWKKVIKD